MQQGGIAPRSARAFPLACIIISAPCSHPSTLHPPTLYDIAAALAAATRASSRPGLGVRQSPRGRGAARPAPAQPRVLPSGRGPAVRVDPTTWAGRTGVRGSRGPGPPHGGLRNRPARLWRPAAQRARLSHSASLLREPRVVRAGPFPFGDVMNKCAQGVCVSRPTPPAPHRGESHRCQSSYTFSIIAFYFDLKLMPKYLYFLL